MPEWIVPILLGIIAATPIIFRVFAEIKAHKEKVLFDKAAAAEKLADELLSDLRDINKECLEENRILRKENRSLENENKDLRNREWSGRPPPDNSLMKE